MGKLAAAAVAGDVLVTEDHGVRLLQALASAVHPVTSPWKVPLVRCVCVNDPITVAAAGSNPGGGGGGGVDGGGGDADGASEGDGEDRDDEVVLTVACYASRLMFELIACDEIKFIMTHLTPSAPVRHPLSTRQ